MSDDERLKYRDRRNTLAEELRRSQSGPSKYIERRDALKAELEQGMASSEDKFKAFYNRTSAAMISCLWQLQKKLREMEEELQSVRTERPGQHWHTTDSAQP